MTAKTKLGMWVAVLCLALVVCLTLKRFIAPEPPEVVASSDHAAVSPQSTPNSPTVPVSVEQAPRSPQNYRSAIEDRKDKESARKAIAAMNELLESWSPVGKSQDEVIEVLGEPSERTDKQLIYTMKTFVGGCQWRLKLDSGLVADVSKSLSR